MATTTTPDKLRPRIGLALGGGGARSLAHVGILKVLEEEGVLPDVIAGTSMGGVIGAGYAAGFSARSIEREILRLAKVTHLVELADRVPSLRALFSGRRFEQYLTESFGADLTFSDLRSRLAVTAVDLHTGQEVVFRSGPVVPALRATMSLPGIFAAVEHGKQRLVDGGVLNNVPADHAKSLGADIVVAVDVLPAFVHPEKDSGGVAAEPASPLELPLAPPGVRDIWEAAFISIGALTAANLETSRPDLVVRPSMSPSITVLMGFHRAEEPIAAGVRAMEAALPQLKRLIEQWPALLPASH